jgi:hypothetical protein
MIAAAPCAIAVNTNCIDDCINEPELTLRSLSGKSQGPPTRIRGSPTLCETVKRLGNCLSARRGESARGAITRTGSSWHCLHELQSRSGRRSAIPGRIIDHRHTTLIADGRLRRRRSQEHTVFVALAAWPGVASPVRSHNHIAGL